jgi:glycosyltransferase involved in cell wall biosynthesis
MNPQPLRRKMMKASIIIPTHNKAMYLEYTLESLFHQSYEKSQYEVIVVHEGEDDGTEQIIKCFSGRKWNIHYIKHKALSKAVNRNIGIQSSNGEILFFIDDDCICSKDWIAEHLIQHTETNSKVVIGQRREVFTHIPFTQERFFPVLKTSLDDINPFVSENFLDIIFLYLRDKCNIISIADVIDNLEKIHALSLPIHTPLLDLQAIAESKYACPWLCLATNFSINKETLLQKGLFDEKFRGWGEEDLELGYRLFRANIQFGAVPEAIVYHQMHPSDWKKQLKEWFCNYLYFTEKYQTLELYLRWQVFYKIISMTQYEVMVRKMETGCLNKGEEQLIKEQYANFILSKVKEQLIKDQHANFITTSGEKFEE